MYQTIGQSRHTHTNVFTHCPRKDLREPEVDVAAKPPVYVYAHR